MMVEVVCIQVQRISSFFIPYSRLYKVIRSAACPGQRLRGDLSHNMAFQHQETHPVNMSSQLNQNSLADCVAQSLDVERLERTVMVFSSRHEAGPS